MLSVHEASYVDGSGVASRERIRVSQFLFRYLAVGAEKRSREGVLELYLDRIKRWSIEELE